MGLITPENSMLRVSHHLDTEVQMRLRWLNHLDEVPRQYRDPFGSLLDSLEKYWRDRRLGRVASISTAELQLIAMVWIDASEHDGSIQELAQLGSFVLDILEAEST